MNTELKAQIENIANLELEEKVQTINEVKELFTKRILQE